MFPPCRGILTVRSSQIKKRRSVIADHVSAGNFDPFLLPGFWSAQNIIIMIIIRPELELNQNSRPKREKNQKPSMVPHFFIDGPKVLVQEFSSGGARREFGEFSSSGTGFEPDQKK